MIDAKNIFLVTNDLEDGIFDVTTLHLWINSDISFYVNKRKKRKLTWVILAAYDTREKAEEHVKKLGLSSK